MHKTKRIRTPWGQRVSIDLGVIDLVRAAWNVGILTEYCCQDTGQTNYCGPLAYVSVVGIASGEFFIYAATGQEDVDLSLLEMGNDLPPHAQMTLHWYGWEFIMSDSDEEIVQCYFPVKDITTITEHLTQFAVKHPNNGFAARFKSFCTAIKHRQTAA